MSLTAKVIVAAFLIVAGLSLAGVSVLAIVDPVGTKMADDGDPFGRPPSRVSSALVAVAGVAFVVGGIWVIGRAITSSRRAG